MADPISAPAASSTERRTDLGLALCVHSGSVHICASSEDQTRTLLSRRLAVARIEATSTYAPDGRHTGDQVGHQLGRKVTPYSTSIPLFHGWFGDRVLTHTRRRRRPSASARVGGHRMSAPTAPCCREISCRHQLCADLLTHKSAPTQSEHPTTTQSVGGSGRAWLMLSESSGSTISA